jgi:hypothetical protein
MAGGMVYNPHVGYPTGLVIRVPSMRPDLRVPECEARKSSR